MMDELTGRRTGIQNGQSVRSLLREDWRHLQELGGSDRPLRFWKLVSPRFAHIVLIRLSLSAKRKGWTVLAKLFSFLLYFGFRVELNTNAEIGPGLVLPHPMGIVIGAHHIGARVLIYQNVTLGAKSPDIAYDPSLRPHLCDNVTIGSGAVIVGGVRIGNGSAVAANSLVTRDVEGDMIAIGVPAQSKPIPNPRIDSKRPSNS